MVHKTKKESQLSSWLYGSILLIGLALLILLPQKISVSKTQAQDYFQQLMNAATPIPHSDTIQLGFFIPTSTTPAASGAEPTIPGATATRGPRPSAGPTRPPAPTYTPEQTCGMIVPTNTFVTIVPNTIVPGGSGPGCCVWEGYKGNDQCCHGVPQINFPPYGPWCNAKPVIYLYPTKTTYINVSLDIAGNIIKSDPLYPQNGWKDLLAYPNGNLSYQGKSYRELFYESSLSYHEPPSGGIVVSKEKIKPALDQLVTSLGLSKNEKAEFLSYWLPKLSSLNKPYLLISLFTQDKKDLFDRVTIDPKPNTFIQFILYFKPLSQSVVLTPPQLPQLPVRTGFTAVEWGGIIDQ